MRILPVILALMLPLGGVAGAKLIATNQTNLGVVNILDYGGNNGGSSVDNGPACTAALNALGLNIGGIILFPKGNYNFNTSCTVPAFSTGAVVLFQMTGATLSTSSAIPIINRMPASDSQAQVLIDAVFRFAGGRFVGNNTSGQTGIFLGASYSPSFVDMQFNSLDIGLDCAFCLDGYARNVRTTKNSTTGMRLESGVGHWSGATLNGSQSNVFRMSGVRDYALSGAQCAWQVLGSDGVVISDAITEGAAPTDDVCFDDQQSTTVKSFTIKGLHVENAGSPTSVIKLAGRGSETFDFSRVFIQGDPVSAVDASGIGPGSSTINILDWPYWTAPFSTSSSDNNSWQFRGWNSPTPITDPSWWIGGIVPAQLQNLGGRQGWSVLQYSWMQFGDPAATGADGKGSYFNGGQFYTQNDKWAFGGTINQASGYPYKIWSGTGGVSSIGPIIQQGLTWSQLGNAAGSIVYMTDGNAADCGDTSCTTWGTPITGGGGSLKLLVWDNGTNWTLIGK